MTHKTPVRRLGQRKAGLFRQALRQGTDPAPGTEDLLASCGSSE